MISFKSLTGKKEEPKEPAAQTPEDKSNIFGQALSAGKMAKAKKADYLKSKNRKRAYLTLGASLVGLMLYSVFFFYSNAVAYIKAPAEIATVQNQIEEYNEVTLPSLEKTRELHKAAYDKEFEEIIAALDTVFPDNIDKLGIVQLFESFATEVAASFPPFEFTSINLASPQQKNGYLVIPVSTSIHSSLAGFDRFLTLVDRSGYIYSGKGEDKELVEQKIRLMNISNISVKYRGVDEATGKDQGVDFSVKLNLYSRSTAQQTEN